jgi:hypothetical protein
MNNDHVADAALIAALSDVLEGARGCFEHYKRQEELGVWLPHPSPSIDELAKPIIAAMEAHPKFKENENRFFGSKQLMRHAFYQSRNLLKVAVDRGPLAAVAWYHKVHSAERADLRYVAEVYGLKVVNRVTLSNRVSLVPLEDLPPSDNAKAVKAQFEITPRRLPLSILPLPIGAILEIQDVPGYSWENPNRDQTVPPRSDELERTLRAFTLVKEASPVVGTSWLEFVDDDLRMAEFGMMRMTPRFEGMLSFSTIDVDPEAIEWVELYLNLSASLRPQCDVAIERLNLARRRSSAGNKAIEGGICLEALLGADANQEITYRLRLRAALLLSADFNERREISKAVNEFYALRSKTVHGAQYEPGNIQKNDPCAALGLDICARVLRKIVSLNKKFVPEDWELAGGQPQ